MLLKKWYYTGSHLSLEMELFCILAGNHFRFRWSAGILAVVLPFWLLDWLKPKWILNKHERAGICYEPVACCSCVWHVWDQCSVCCMLMLECKITVGTWAWKVHAKSDSPFFSRWDFSLTPGRISIIAAGSSHMLVQCQTLHSGAKQYLYSYHFTWRKGTQ